MTEGNIAKWGVKEGDSFSAGDVLLEIETDKATMDVEAQEDGIVMKIMQGDGSKAVQVGTRIAVIAEPGDDLASLEIPADEKPAAATSKAPEPEPAKSEAKAPNNAEQKSKESVGASGKANKQIYPLLPSVAQLVAENGLDEATVAQIPPTGPNGRLLKGDVLAYLGAITASKPGAISDMFKRLSHLDLSNIKVAERKVPPPKKVEEPVVPAVEEVEIAVPISLEKVIKIQKKVQSTLDTHIPLSTFIARATDYANDDLPPSSREPTADELFDKILGLDKLKPRGSRGFYIPQMAALPEVSLKKQAPKQPDIIDILAAPKGALQPVPPPMFYGPPETSIFSLVVSPSDEKRAMVFLTRLKTILEKEPGRLVV